jgi:hypothetical protein
VSLQVDQLLDSLRKTGTIDSQGAFTLSLSKARAKLAQFQSSDPARYLVSILSGGVGGGASSIRMTDHGTKVSVWMDGAYLAEEDLLAALNSAYEGEENGALDLVLGCRGALSYGADKIEIRVSGADQADYLWILEQDSEEGRKEEISEAQGVGVDIVFDETIIERLERFVSKFRGYAGQRREFQMVERLADRCPVPVTLDGELVVRPFYLPNGPLEIQVGQVSSVSFSQSPMQFSRFQDWSAGLVCRAGRVSLVVRGVVCGSVDSDDFSGVVYHDSLGLDLTREKVRVGEEADRFLDQLEELRCQVLFRLGDSLRSCSAEVPWFFCELFHLALESQVEDQERLKILDFLRSRFQIDVAGSGTDALLWAGTELACRVGPEKFTLREAFLLKRCSLEFKEAKRELRWIPLTSRYYQAVWPERTLVRGYILLGWGALYEIHGVSSSAQECWLEALDTVRAGTDDRAEELIHAHMDFEPEHILVEVGKALALQAVRMSG